MHKNLEVEPTVIRVQSGLLSTSISTGDEHNLYISETISSFAAWVYDTWKNYSLSLYVGSIVIFLSCVIMLYPWYNVRVQRLKQEHLNEGKDGQDGKTNRSKSEGAIIKTEETAVYFTREFTFFNVSKIFQYIKLIHMYAL